MKGNASLEATAGILRRVIFIMTVINPFNSKL